MHLNLARWIVELRVRPPALADVLAQRYTGFACTPVAEADLLVEVENATLLAGSMTDDPGSLLNASLVGRRDQYLLDGPGFYGIIDPRRGFAELQARGNDAGRDVEYFLRITLALFALRRDGLLLHCAAMKRAEAASGHGGNRTAYLFIGQSGSGKSTLVALSQAAGRALALGDDLILLRREPAGWRAYGTPFWNSGAGGREGEAESGLVAGIYKLIQDRAVFVEPMGRAAAAAELLANCPIVNDQPDLLTVLFDRCRDVAGEIAIRRLHFRKDDAFWDVIARETPC